ncbi:MAG: triose-phosphate isomerase [Candidatus Paceibacterota bacterium]
MKNKLIIANWKCNPTKAKEGEKILNDIKKNLNTKNKVVICPPVIFLSQYFDLFSSFFSFGVQDLHYKEKGPYTGEISPKMAQDVGCKYAIIGHSERRTILKETDQEINLKLQQIITTTKITPILCIGESGEERKAKKTNLIIKKQLDLSLRNIPKDKAEKIVIAYEPIWAIGTGVVATEEEISEAKDNIVKILCDIYGNKTASQIKIIYGGSVDANNIASILNTGMDGVLVGGASLKPKDFSMIANCK